jgi:hypothetical protein
MARELASPGSGCHCGTGTTPGAIRSRPSKNAAIAAGVPSRYGDRAGVVVVLLGLVELLGVPRAVLQARGEDGRRLVEQVLRDARGKNVEEVKGLLARRWRAS